MWLSPRRPPLQGITMADSIEITVDGIDETARGFASVRKELNNKLNALCRTLIRNATKEARTKYNSFKLQEPTVIGVRSEKQENGWRSIATGEPAYGRDGEIYGTTVGFLEFGTGIFAGEGHPLAQEFGATPGSWSSTYGTGQFAENYAKGEPWWEHNGVIHIGGYTGTNAMYNAGQHMKESVPQVAEEVFK